MAGLAVYRALLRLYPASFRRRYGADLAQHFSDLVADRGVWAAWARTGVDLAVTVPRYRLESVVNHTQGDIAVVAVAGVLAVAGTLSMLLGLYPGVVLLAAGVVLAGGHRGQLAQALRVPDRRRRRRRLRTAAVLAGVFVVSFAAYLVLIGDEWTLRETVLAAIGTPAMVGAVVFLVAGLLTPRAGATSQPAPPS